MSYDNSFSAIKTNIFNFKGGVSNHTGTAQAVQDNISTEEKPNKPREEIALKHQSVSLNQTNEINLLNITTLPSNNEEIFNRTTHLA